MSESKCQTTNTNQNDSRKNSLNGGLVMIPTNVRKMALFSTSHKRMGSTGTTGDESYTTDEEDEVDEPDFGKHFDNNNYGTYSTISTITDKINPHINHDSIMKRNSSDISVYSGLVENSDESANSNESTSSSWTKSSNDDIDKFTFTELKNSLREAHRQLEDRTEEVLKLNRSKAEVEAELEDLTASLFQEAHNMVREANERQSAAERALRESEMKNEVLIAEVAALKTLVLTSTPSHPNPHLHPQIDKNKDDQVVVTFSKKQFGSSPVHEINTSPSTEHSESNCNNGENSSILFDSILYNEFISWKDDPKIDKTCSFIERIYKEDIDLCLSFTNSELSEKLVESVEKGEILIEPVGEKSKTYPRTCALMEDSNECFYRINLGNENEWYNISQICRNRIIAVCDFLNYLKYIERGLVKSSAEDMYCEIMKLRKKMVLGRFGFQTKS